MKTILIIAGLFFLFSPNGYSQATIKDGVRFDTITPLKSRWGFEGALGLAFGDATSINIAPQVRYSQSVYFSIGGGVSYCHYDLSYRGNKQKMNYIGLNTFARFTPFPNLAFQIQPEILRCWGTSNTQKVSGRFIPTFLAGGGIVIPTGTGNIDLLFLFDVIQYKYTPYGSNLYYSIGYSFRL